jgi:hypothetical protein
MEPLLRIIKINSPDDLPPEEGHYWTFQGDIHCLTSEPYNKEVTDYWLANVQWYLAPREQTDKRLIYHLDCDKCGDSFWSNEAFPKPQHCYKCEQEQQEKKTSWRDFTMREPEIPMKEVKSLRIMRNIFLMGYTECNVGVPKNEALKWFDKTYKTDASQFQSEQRQVTERCKECGDLLDKCDCK